MIIYKTTNLVNNKIYVGKYEGSKKAYLGSGILLRRAITKYGKDNFKRIIIDIAENRQDLNRKEIFWVKFYDARNPEIGYNIADGGQGGNLGEAAIAKMRAFRIGTCQSEETKKKISTALKNRVFSNETREKMSASKKGRLLSEETKRRCAEAHKGKKHSEETKEKMRMSKLAEKCFWYGKSRSEETKKKIGSSIRVRARHND